MKWADLDLTEARWTMQEVSGHSEFVFPAFHTPKRPMSENTVYQALKKLG